MLSASNTVLYWLGESNTPILRSFVADVRVRGVTGGARIRGERGVVRGVAGGRGVRAGLVAVGVLDEGGDKENRGGPMPAPEGVSAALVLDLVRARVGVSSGGVEGNAGAAGAAGGAGECGTTGESDVVGCNGTDDGSNDLHICPVVLHARQNVAVHAFRGHSFHINLGNMGVSTLVNFNSAKRFASSSIE